MKAFVHIQCCQIYFNKASCVVFEAAPEKFCSNTNKRV